MTIILERDVCTILDSYIFILIIGSSTQTYKFEKYSRGIGIEKGVRKTS
jgi:hypothetical protein